MKGWTDEGSSRGVAGDGAVDLADQHVVPADFELQARTHGEPAPAAFNVRCVDYPLGVVLTLGGELDLATAPVLQEQLDQAMPGATAVVIDLSGLRFIDSSGLAILLRAEEQLRGSGGHLAFVRGPRAVHRVFELTQLNSRFDVCDSPSAAFRTALERHIGSAGSPSRREADRQRPSSTATSEE